MWLLTWQCVGLIIYLSYCNASPLLQPVNPPAKRRSKSIVTVAKIANQQFERNSNSSSIGGFFSSSCSCSSLSHGYRAPFSHEMVAHSSLCFCHSVVVGRSILGSLRDGGVLGSHGDWSSSGLRPLCILSSFLDSTDLKWRLEFGPSRLRFFQPELKFFLGVFDFSAMMQACLIVAGVLYCALLEKLETTCMVQSLLDGVHGCQSWAHLATGMLTRIAAGALAGVVWMAAGGIGNGCIDYVVSIMAPRAQEAK
nr:hypothetical protein Iba_chr04aCG16480 [Ipomoea batatas]